jgi:predicted kinase
VAERWTRFATRLAQGRAVHGHGDLHLQHVWYEQPHAAPLVIDCTQFRRAFREIDAASEVAFLAMDLAYRGRRDLGEHFLRSYAARSDDYGLYSVVDYFLSYRAAVRAKVGELARRDPEVAPAQRERAEQSAREHLTLAAAALAERPSGALVIVCGKVGTGKSFAAARLAERVDGVAIASDRVRKQLAGLDPLARDGSARGIYSQPMTDATYQGMRERALPVLGSGRTAILDATHSTRGLRERTRAWAETLGLEPWLLEVSCSDALARERLATRRARDDDPSDAGPELQAASANGYDPPREWSAHRHFRVNSEEPGWERQLEPLAERIARR